MDWATMVTVGRIIRPQHNRGEVVVVSETDYPDERFAPGATVFTLRDDSVVALLVVESREQDGRWIVRFGHVGSITEAETLRGLELRIAVTSLRPLPSGRYYTHDLVGCDVRTVGGVRVGPIARVDLGVGVPMLVVDGTQGEVLVPFTEAFCRRVDITARVVEIDPPDGLMELNAPSGRRS